MTLSKLIRCLCIACVIGISVVHIYLTMAKHKKVPLTFQNVTYAQRTTSWTFHDVSNKHLQTQFQFLKEYKNPCWYEPILSDEELEKERQLGLRYRFTRHINYTHLKSYYNRKRLNGEKIPQQLSCLPYFMLIGVAKCGSTDLFHRIVQHPDIVVPPEKETHWWGVTKHERNEPIQHYIRFFAEPAITIEHSVTAKNGTHSHIMVTGEGSPSTVWRTDYWKWYPGNENKTEPVITIADLVRQRIPHVKLIVILRNPIERLISGYMFFKKHEKKSAELFHKKATDIIEMFTKCMSKYSVRRCYYNTLTKNDKFCLRAGMYAVYLHDWLDVFPRDQLLILRTEDYSEDPISTMQTVYDFLQLRKLPNEYIQLITSRSGIINKGRSEKIIPYNETLQMLKRFYKPFNEQLAKLLNSKKFLWNTETR